MPIQEAEYCSRSTEFAAIKQNANFFNNQPDFPAPHHNKPSEELNPTFGQVSPRHASSRDLIPKNGFLITKMPPV